MGSMKLRMGVPLGIGFKSPPSRTSPTNCTTQGPAPELYSQAASPGESVRAGLVQAPVAVSYVEVAAGSCFVTVRCAERKEAAKIVGTELSPQSNWFAISADAPGATVERVKPSVCDGTPPWTSR